MNTEQERAEFEAWWRKHFEYVDLDAFEMEIAWDAYQAGRAALRASGWQEGEDPATEGLYVVRDSKGNVEVGMWYARTFNGQPAEWSKEFRDVDRDDIVAWIRIPPYVRADG